MEGDVPSTVQSLHLIAHVLKQQLVLVQVHLQPASEEAEQKLHSGCRDYALQRKMLRFNQLVMSHGGCESIDTFSNP